jgi:hypothetical protein
MQGMIFAGCSFTWGQGLYYYSEMKTLVDQRGSSFDQKLISPAHLKYMQAFRFPRLVANHFKTFEIVKRNNGGSDDSAISFINNILFDGGHMEDGSFDPSEISHIIFQSSKVQRNKFEFELDGEKYVTDFGNESKKLIEWISRNDLDFNKAFDLFKNQVAARIKSSFERYEALGIKCSILSWPIDMVDVFNSNPYLLKRSIQLRYRDQIYDCIDDLIADNKGMLITDDENNLSSFRDDSHPSLECHRIIASSIIANIEDDI